MRKVEYNEDGSMKTCDEYTEILRLRELLQTAEIPHEFRKSLDGWQICYPDSGLDTRKCSIIESYGSYGNEENLLEIMGLLTKEEESEDSVVGYLTAEEVFVRIFDSCYGEK